MHSEKYICNQITNLLKNFYIKSINSKINITIKI